MKKFTKLIALITALIMALGCFTSCSLFESKKSSKKDSKKHSRDKDEDDDEDDDDKDKKKPESKPEDYAGVYVANIDATQYFAENLLGTTDVTGYVSMPLEITLEVDGSYVMGLDADEYLEQSKVFIMDNIDSLLLNATGMTVAEIASAQGSSEQDVLDMFAESFEQGLAEQNLSDMSVEGTYEIDGTTIRLKNGNVTTEGTIEDGKIITDANLPGGFDQYASLFPDGKIVFEMQ